MYFNPSNKRVLLVSAHPDDEVLGVGGTVYKLSQEGHQIDLCIFTDGSSTQYSDDTVIRDKKFGECRKAMDVLGVRKIIQLDFPDMQLDRVKHHIINDAMSKVIREIDPEIVFCPSPHELNKDHQILAESLKVAIRPVGNFPRKIYFYEVLSSGEWNLDSPFPPNAFYDIGLCIEEKIRAFKCYESEMRIYPHPRSVEGIKILGSYRGLQSGVRFAEAFMIYREVT